MDEILGATSGEEVTTTSQPETVNNVCGVRYMLLKSKHLNHIYSQKLFLLPSANEVTER